jgi:hypothetical protein
MPPTSARARRRQPFRVMPDLARRLLRHERDADRPDAELLERAQLERAGHDRVGPPILVARRQRLRHRHGVVNDAIEQLPPEVPLDGQQVIEHAEVVRLAGLGHQVRDEDPHTARFPHRLRDVGHKQRRKDAGVEAAGAGHDCIGVADRVADAPGTARSLGQQPETDDRAAGTRDRGLAAEDSAVAELRDQRHHLRRGGEDDPVRAEQPRRNVDRLGEVVRDVGKCRDHEVADRVAVQSFARAEAVLKDVGDFRVAAAQRREAVPDVARRDHLELVPQPSRASAIVGRRDDRDQSFARGVVRAFGEHQRVKPPQHVGQACAAANRDDARRRSRVELGSERRRALCGCLRHHDSSCPASARTCGAASPA